MPLRYLMSRDEVERRAGAAPTTNEAALSRSSTPSTFVSKSCSPLLSRSGSGAPNLLRGVQNKGETYTSSGICQERQITGFLRDARSQKRRKFCPQHFASLSCSAQALGNHPWPPVERMRSTHGRIYGVPENKLRDTTASPTRIWPPRTILHRRPPRCTKKRTT